MMSAAVLPLLLFLALSNSIVAPGAKLEKLFDSGVFTEGPAAAPDGTIYFSDITGSARSREAGHIMRFDPRSRSVRVFRSPSGMANGMMFDLEGRLVVAEGADFGGRRITRTDMASGKSERVATTYEGRPLNSPNDLTIDARGRIYFTDPRYVGAEPVEQPVEGVYRIDPDGTLTRIIADAGRPNGIAISPDQKTLYVATTPDPRRRNGIAAYDLGADGSVRIRGPFVTFEQGYADGMTIDAGGNLYCGCGSLGVVVYSPAGEEVGRIEVPGSVTNVEFGRGRDRSSLYITAGGALYRSRLTQTGHHPADR